ncbi:CTD phosphatase Fcp1 [Spiromyces aspiralis]|uniref:CTD phosphatase Fcp1 n=1 Tax=Spiromyces aspiralis TaxID=68401 RepID=A0ACC1HFA4_9FUNG|nr:CTD phosphatase Fcp1 [Spiromyces aspiralis]
MFDEFKSGSELEEEEEDGGETSEDLPDVTNILPIMKNAVLQDCRFVFSAVIPINPGMPPPHRSDIWRWATEFGAECQLEIDDSTTHVVAGKPGTEKVHQARRLNIRDPKRKNSPINIVPVSWLLNSISRWSRLDEGPYLMYPNEEHRQRKTGENGKAEDIDDIPTTDTEQPPKEVLERVESFVVHGTSGQPELAESGENNENEAQGAESSGSAAVQAVRRVGDSRRDTDIELEKQEREIQEHSKDARERLNSIDWDEEDKVFMEMMRASDSEAGSVVESSREQTRQSPTLAVRRQRADDDYSNSSDMNDSRQATITRRPGVTKRRRVVDDGSDTSTPLFGGSRLHEDEDHDNNDVVVGSGKSVGSTILSQLRKGGGAIDLDTSDTDENSDVEEGYQEDTEGDDDDHDDNDHDDDEDEEEVQQFSDDDESDGEVEEEGTSGGEFDDLINQLGGKLEDESG